MTHRCKELLKHNKNYKDGSETRIKYGYQFENCYNVKNKDKKGWWLSYLKWDMDWDNKYMYPIIRIDYCPFCGIHLEDINDK